MDLPQMGEERAGTAGVWGESMSLGKTYGVDLELGQVEKLATQRRLQTQLRFRTSRNKRQPDDQPRR
jgi:hypothetical protein